MLITSIYLSIRFYKSCHRLPETKRHSSLFLHWSVSKFLVVMAACTPSIHVFLGRPLFLLSSGTHSIINFGILSSGILLTWPYNSKWHQVGVSFFNCYTTCLQVKYQNLTSEKASPHTAENPDQNELLRLRRQVTHTTVHGHSGYLHHNSTRAYRFSTR